FRIPPRTSPNDGGSPLLFASVGRTLAYRHGTERGIQLWDMTGDREPIKVGRIMPLSAGDVAFSPDGQVVALGNDMGGIGLWSVKDGKEVGVSTPSPRSRYTGS